MAKAAKRTTKAAPPKQTAPEPAPAPAPAPAFTGRQDLRNNTDPECVHDYQPTAPGSRAQQCHKCGEMRWSMT